ncbi:MAG: hypothetical protein JOY90_23500 [Bradyrhizobium sp.]|nr:hypothetical protein [Bradyrhizobium sp.]MBV9563385.1 hypothetical protein [Bradyrhizobium sp.]
MKRARTKAKSAALPIGLPLPFMFMTAAGILAMTALMMAALMSTGYLP